MKFIIDDTNINKSIIEKIGGRCKLWIESKWSTFRINWLVESSTNCIAWAARNNVKIGNYTQINQNTVIHDNVIIGDYCYIKSGSVIGEDGFGFDFEEDDFNDLEVDERVNSELITFDLNFPDPL